MSEKEFGGVPGISHEFGVIHEFGIIREVPIAVAVVGMDLDEWYPLLVTDSKLAS
ncbi:MAG: hypothetical protein GY904_25970 [Planctomycetaceae bacterium]|nr:hypothetical protein [Planctomycetaceae bacterium]